MWKGLSMGLIGSTKESSTIYTNKSGESHAHTILSFSLNEITKKRPPGEDRDGVADRIREIIMEHCSKGAKLNKKESEVAVNIIKQLEEYRYSLLYKNS